MQFVQPRNLLLDFVFIFVHIEIKRVPVSVSEWLFGSFVLILYSLVMMSISPVSTVIFPTVETAMLSCKNGRFGAKCSIFWEQNFR